MKLKAVSDVTAANKALPRSRPISISGGERFALERVRLFSFTKLEPLRENKTDLYLQM